MNQTRRIRGLAIDQLHELLGDTRFSPNGSADDWRELATTLESCGLNGAAGLARDVMMDKDMEALCGT